MRDDHVPVNTAQDSTPCPLAEKFCNFYCTCWQCPLTPVLIFFMTRNQTWHLERANLGKAIASGHIILQCHGTLKLQKTAATGKNQSPENFASTIVHENKKSNSEAKCASLFDCSTCSSSTNNLFVDENLIHRDDPIF